MTLSVAVVIPTYRRPQLLTRCLEALSRQSLAGHSFEVIVVDDGCTEATRQVVEEFHRRCQGAPAFRYLQPRGTRGPAAARNRGWRASSAALIAFTDDDTEPHADWLLEGCKAMTRCAVAVGGRVVVPTRPRPTDHERMTQGLEQAEFATANAFVWRHALVSVGGFDERFKRAWREDSDLHFSLLQLGHVGWAPKAMVVHPVRPEQWGVSLRQQANVFFDALLFKKHPHLYRLKIRPTPPWHYHLIVFGTLLALFSLWQGWSAVAAGAGVVVMAGLGRFVAARLKGASLAPAHVAEMLLTSVAIPFLSLYWRVRGALHFRVLFF